MKDVRVLSIAILICLTSFPAASTAATKKNPTASSPIKRLPEGNDGLGQFDEQFHQKAALVALNSPSTSASGENTMGGTAEPNNNIHSTPDAIINSTTLQSSGEGSGSDVSSASGSGDQGGNNLKVCEHNPRPKKCHPNSDQQ